MKMSGEFTAPPFAPITRPAFELFTRAVFRFWCKLEVKGRDRLPPLPFIICGNHTSHMDSVALMAAAGYSFDRFAMLGASDYFFGSFPARIGFASMVKIIPLDRSPSPKSFQQTVTACRRFVEDRAHGLILFPEGTRSRTGEIGPFRRGASLFAAELGLPVVPALITGAGKALPIGGFLPHRGDVCVSFAEPLYPSRSCCGPETAAEMRERILELQGKQGKVQAYGA